MNLYHRNLRKIGVIMILAAVGNLIFELLIRDYLSRVGSPFLVKLPRPWGIWVKNAIGVLAGHVGLIFNVRKRQYTAGTLILLGLCLLEALVIMLSTGGARDVRTNGLFDITMLMMVLLTYTLSQTDRDQKRWANVRTREPATLDLRLRHTEDFFDPIQLGPAMAINPAYARVIRRYISDMPEPVPLRINLLCSEPVAENMRDMMREVIDMHFAAEETRVTRSLEMRYRRILLLVSVSVFVVALVRQTTLLTDEMIMWEIIGNFAAFGLWQVGYTHYERNEGYDELLNLHIAKYASLRFVER